ncbi:aminoglycoside adenylyltransferase family protein [Pontibaca methylaminivorans]|uniref:aminoglycoside adenylyltransferase family protein n=1 Tax=Pontibaca methylaminivorans TaxID=515897 RepID=UPI002FDB1387
MQQTPDMPHRTDQVRSVPDLLRRRLGDALLGVYLHGSAVTGGLRPQSDIDFLAVVDSELTASQRRHLLMDLLRLSGCHPPVAGTPRCLEVMVFRRPDLAADDYPARAEFVYGEWLREAFEAGESPMPGRDPEYSLLIAQARAEAVALLGPPADKLLPQVPPERIRRAMRDALPALLDGLHTDRRNVLLTLARMWHTASTGQFVTKDAAARWAVPRLSAPYAAILDHARAAYRGEVTDDWSDQGDAARQVAGYMSERVLDLL